VHAALILLAAVAAIDVPVDVVVPNAPTPVRADGKLHLVYELHVTNFRARNLELIEADVIDDDSGAVLASYRDGDLSAILARPGAPADLTEKRIIGGGMRAILFFDIAPAEAPHALRHRLTFKREDTETALDTARVDVVRRAPITLAPPLTGDRWVAANALSNGSSHRRSIVVVNGRARIAQRFAIDWIRLGPDGQAFHGDPANNANWYGYGSEVLAVANGVVSDIKDGIPENDPTADHKAVPITLETVGGNYVIVDVGGGFYAFFAHLQPGSLRVKVGDHVGRGHVLALLGNSGNSDAPHLHFHVGDANSPLGAEGVPYVFRSYEVMGVLTSLKVLEGGEGWKADPAKPAERRDAELPTENQIVRFAGRPRLKPVATR